MAKFKGLGMFQSSPDEYQAYQEMRAKALACPVTGLGGEFKPFDEQYLNNPYLFLERARNEQPVFYSPEIGYWVITKYDDMVAIFKDPVTYSAAIARHPVVPLSPEAIAKRNEYDIAIEPALVDEEPSTHRPHRRIFGDAFTPKRVNELEPRIREIVNRYIDRFIDQGRADMVADLMYEVPALAVFIFLGAEDDDAVLVKQLAGPRAVVNFGLPNISEQVSMMEDIGKHWEFTKALVDAALETPGDNYLGDLARLYHEDNSRFTINYLYNVVFVLMFAGHETTTQVTASGIKALLENREQWEALCQNPELIPNAVEEILRYDSSIFAWRRITTKPVEIGGISIPEGAKLLLMTGSGNHDDRVFPEGKRFDVRRKNAKRHLALGKGPHYCMGAPLARLEMRVVLEELTRRVPHMQLVEKQTLEYLPTLVFRGPKALWVEWDVSQNPS